MIADRPSGHAFVPSLNPPAVENAEARHTVERRLHATGARSFIGTLRCVQPEIYSSGKQCSQGPVIVLEIHNLELIGAELPGELKDLTDLRLRRIVGRVGLATVDNLQASQFPCQALQPIGICEDQVAALVGRGATRESDSEYVGTELQPSTVLDRGDQSPLAFEMRLRNLAFGNLHGIAQLQIVFSPARKMTIE